MPAAQFDARRGPGSVFGRGIVIARKTESAENRMAFELPADGWFQILKVGEWPHAGSGTVQIVDKRSCDEIVRRFAAQKEEENFPGLLLDYDHFSRHAEQPSEAAAWIEELEAREDGVWARARWTPTGKASVEGGEYRLISPVLAEFEPADAQDSTRQRPLRVVSVALTNDPNIRTMKPVSNRDAGGDPGGKKSTARNGARNNAMNHKELLIKLLGLEPGASDDDIQGAYDALTADMRRKNMADEEKAKGAVEEANRLRAENAKLKADAEAAQNRRVEETMETYKDAIGDKDADKQAWRNRLVRDFDAAKDLLAEKAAITASANRGRQGQPRREGVTPAKPVHNRDAGGRPGSPDSEFDDDALGASAVRIEAVDLAKNRGIPFTRAWKECVNRAIAQGRLKLKDAGE